MQPQTTQIEKLILSALIALVTAAVSTTVEVPANTEYPLPTLNPLILASQ
ncbi:MAG: hypothetical protein SWJ54_17150 [Cyanobacteriota bacterium]|nr:hypothetical protein [Cyanobacteriota bacterium]